MYRAPTNGNGRHGREGTPPLDGVARPYPPTIHRKHSEILEGNYQVEGMEGYEPETSTRGHGSPLPTQTEASSRKCDPLPINPPYPPSWHVHQGNPRAISMEGSLHQPSMIRQQPSTTEVRYGC